MAVTRANAPVLDDTLARLNTVLEQGDALLSMMVESAEPESITDIMEVARIIRQGSVEANERTYPIGTYIDIPWKFYNAAGTSYTEYTIPFVVTGHRLVETENGQTVPGMFLMSEKLLPPCTFDWPEIACDFEEGLEPGLYYMDDINSSTAFSFTTTQAIPANGFISVQYISSAYHVLSYATLDSENPIEEIIATNGITEGATQVGSFGGGGHAHDDMNVAVYGSGSWADSCIRQYMNTNPPLNQLWNWWVPKHKYDFCSMGIRTARRPICSGFSTEFLMSARPIKIRTWTGVEGEYEETYDRFWIPSNYEMGIVSPNYTPYEGEEPLLYWLRRRGIATPVAASGDTDDSMTSQYIVNDNVYDWYHRDIGTSPHLVYYTGIPPKTNSVMAAKNTSYVALNCCIC